VDVDGYDRLRCGHRRGLGPVLPGGRTPRSGGGRGSGAVPGLSAQGRPGASGESLDRGGQVPAGLGGPAVGRVRVTATLDGGRPDQCGATRCARPRSSGSSAGPWTAAARDQRRSGGSPRRTSWPATPHRSPQLCRPAAVAAPRVAALGSFRMRRKRARRGRTCSVVEPWSRTRRAGRVPTGAALRRTAGRSACRPPGPPRPVRGPRSRSPRRRPVTAHERGRPGPGGAGATWCWAHADTTAATVDITTRSWPGTLTTSRSARAGAPRHVVTVAAPTSSPDTSPTSSPTMTRIRRYVVVLNGGQQSARRSWPAPPTSLLHGCITSVLARVGTGWAGPRRRRCVPRWEDAGRDMTDTTRLPPTHRLWSVAQGPAGRHSVRGGG